MYCTYRNTVGNETVNVKDGVRGHVLMCACASRPTFMSHRFRL